MRLLLQGVSTGSQLPHAGRLACSRLSRRERLDDFRPAMDGTAGDRLLCWRQLNTPFGAVAASADSEGLHWTPTQLAQAEIGSVQFASLDKVR